MTSRAISEPRSWRVAAHTVLTFLKRRIAKIMPNLPTAVVFGISVSGKHSCQSSKMPVLLREAQRVSDLPSTNNSSLAATGAYFLFKRFGANTRHRSESPKKRNTPSDTEFIASIIKKREQTAREEADQLDKLMNVDTEADDEFEDLPDSDEDQRARGVGSRRKFSYWAGQARARRRQISARRRFEILTEERERRLNEEKEAIQELD
jgi:hypothetical protein